MIERLEFPIDPAFNVLLKLIRNEIEVDHVTFAVVHSTAKTASVFTTHSDSWRRHYVKSNYVKIDPRYTKLPAKISPVRWSTLKGDPGYEEISKAAKLFGVASDGLTIPTRAGYGERGTLSLYSDMSEQEWSSLIATKMTYLQDRASHLCLSFLGSVNSLPQVFSPQLSRQEKEVLQLYATGLCQADVAEKFKLPDRTIGLYLSSARTKLNALTTDQAVHRARELNIIEV